MKIALCLESPLEFQGGVSVLVEALARGLREHHEIVLVSPDSPDALAGVRAQGIFTEHLRWRPEDVGAASSKELASQLASAGVKLAHFHTAAFGWGNRIPGRCPFPYARRRGLRVFTTVHLAGDALDGYCGPAKPIWFKLLLWPMATLGKLHALSHVEREICVSRHDCALLVRRYWPLRNRFAQIYHSRVRAGSLSPGAGPRRRIILGVGHIARRKGQSILAEAFCRIAANYPDWELWLAGPVFEPDEGKRIQSLAAAANVTPRLRLLGERRDATELMREAAVYVQPSLLEPLGLALQEAMFAGCACIGSNVGGIPELIADASMGMLVEPGNVAALADRLRQFMDSPEARERCGSAAARSMVQRNLTCEHMVRQHLNLYATGQLNG